MLDHLPNECVIEILQKLGLQDLLACVHVSRKVRGLSIVRMGRLNLSLMTVSPVFSDSGYGSDMDSSYEEWEWGCEATSDRITRLHKKISYDQQWDKASVDFKICFSNIKKHKVSDIEKVLERMWRTVFMLLRLCDTTSTQLYISARDVCGVLAKQLAEYAHDEPISVNELFATADVTNTINTFPQSLIYESYHGISMSHVDHGSVSHLLPKGNWSTLPMWNKCHEGALSDCNLLRSPSGNEPMWTADVLFNLIKAWQSGRQFSFLKFKNYDVSPDVGDEDEVYRQRLLRLPLEVFNKLTDAGDSRFPCTFEQDRKPDELVIRCVNCDTNQRLKVSFEYGDLYRDWWDDGYDYDNFFNLQSVCLISKTFT